MEANAEINLDAVRGWLAEENPRAPVGDREAYAHLLVSYFEASVSVMVLGAIVAHPRTAAPMENPHLKVRTASLSAMQKLRRVRNTNIAWAQVKVAIDAALASASASLMDRKE